MIRPEECLEHLQGHVFRCKLGQFGSSKWGQLGLKTSLHQVVVVSTSSLVVPQAESPVLSGSEKETLAFHAHLRTVQWSAPQSPST